VESCYVVQSGLELWGSSTFLPTAFQIVHTAVPSLITIFFQYWNLNSGPCSCQAGAVPIEPCVSLYSFLFYFLKKIHDV
jgi:hypothetical protein